MANKKFVWDSSALTPETADVPGFPVSMRKDGTVETEDLQFIEFTRTNLVDYVTEGYDVEMYREVEKELLDEDGTLKPTKITERIPIKEIDAKQSAVLFKYLSLASWDGSKRGVKPPKFFENAPLTGGQISALADMLNQINHIDAILGTGGNWLVLPTIRRLREADESESQTATLQAP